jgi:hypothetical protein
MVALLTLPVFGLTLAAGPAGQAGGTPRDRAARDRAVALAKATLAKEKAIPAAGIEVENVSATEWQDTSLGCPADGMMYAQRLVSGYKVVLRAAAASYDVHVGEGHAVVCGKSAAGEKAPAAKASPHGETGERAARIAREALASAEGVAVDNVVVKRVRPFSRSETRCAPPPGRKADAGPAYLIELSLGNATFEYYADQKTAYRCDPR